MEIKLKEEYNRYSGREETKLDMTDGELKQLTKEQLGHLMSMGIKGEDYKRVTKIYLVKKAVTNKEKQETKILKRENKLRKRRKEVRRYEMSKETS